MRRTQLFLTEDLHKSLKDESQEVNVTVSELVRTILEDHFHENTREKTEKGIQSLLKMAEADE